MSSTPPIINPTSVEDLNAGTPFVIKKERFWMQHLNIADHLQGYHQLWVDDPELSKWSTRNITSHTLETTLEYLKPRVRSEENPYAESMAIVEPPVVTASTNTKPRLIGTVVFYRFPTSFEPTNPEPGEPEVGYGLHPDFRGKGIATEALKAFLEYYWNISEAPHVNVKSIIAMYGASNPGSGRVLEKSGFEFVGVGDEPAVMGDGTETELRILRIRRPSTV